MNPDRLVKQIFSGCFFHFTSLTETVICRSKKTILLAGLLFLSFFAYAQTPDWLWLRKGSSVNYSIANSIISDSKGNIYVAGEYNAQLILDKTILTTRSSTTGFIAKYDPNGVLIWAKSIDSNAEQPVRCLAITERNDIIYFAGEFTGKVFFDSMGINLGTKNRTTSIFISRVSPSGEFLWANNYASNIPVEQIGQFGGLAIDKKNNAYLSGVYYTAGTASNSNYFIQSYTQKGSLDKIFKTEKNPGKVDITSLWIGSDSAIYLGGDYVDSLKINSKILFGKRNTIKGFVAKLDSSFNLISNLNITPIDSGQTAVNKSIVTDKDGNVYIMGLVVGKILINKILISDSLETFLYIQKYSNNGALLWSKTFDNIVNDSRANNKRNFASFTLDNQQNIICIGTFQLSMKNIQATTKGDLDVIVFKLKNNNGSLLWSKQVGGPKEDIANAVTYSSINDAVTIAGGFNSDSISFDNLILKNGSTFGNMYLANIGTCKQNTFSLNNHSVISCPGDSITLKASPIPGQTLEWKYNNQIISQDSSIKIAQPGFYEVTVKKGNSTCYEQSPLLYSYIVENGNSCIKIYELISPNGDGKNETFFIDNIDRFPEHEVRIFNRWGTEVYKSYNYKNDWDGGALPGGTYLYEVRISSLNKKYNGGLFLTR